MTERRLNTAQRRRQAQLAGAGNIISWVAGDGPDPHTRAHTDAKPPSDVCVGGSGVGSAEPAHERAAVSALGAVAAAYAALDDVDDFAPLGRGRTPEGNSDAREAKSDNLGGNNGSGGNNANGGNSGNGDGRPRTASSAGQREAPSRLGAAGRERPSTSAGRTPAPGSDDPAAPAPPRAPSRAGDAPADAEAAAKLVKAEQTAITGLMGQHSIFLRVLTSRLTESRTVAHMWNSSTSTCTGFLAAMRYLQTSAHESVAVDVLHAAAANNGRMMASRAELSSLLAPEGLAAVVETDEDTHSEVAVPLVGGFPVWTWPDFPCVDWVDSLCPVLEGILYSSYEDYLSVGLTAIGHVLEALSPLFTLAARCTDADLEDVMMQQILGEDGESDDASTTDDDTDDSSKLDDGTTPSKHFRALRRRTAARQSVAVTKATFPWLAALSHAAAYGGRVAKMVQPRLARLSAMHDTVRHLVAASTLADASERVEPAVKLPGPRYNRNQAQDSKFDDSRDAGDGGDSDS